MKRHLLGGGHHPHHLLPPQRLPRPPLSFLSLPPWPPWPRPYFSQPGVFWFLLFLQNFLTLWPASQARHWAVKARQQNLGFS